MWKNPLAQAFLDFQKETENLQKRIKKATKKHDATHDFRVFYKKIKSHISLFNSLGETHIVLTEQLQEFYQQIWYFRDAKVFRDLCKKYTKNNKTMMVFAEDRLIRAQEKLNDYKRGVSFKKLTVQLTEIITLLVTSSQNFDPKWIQAWLEAYFERTENLLNQLVHTHTVTDVWLHTIRKNIKKVLYLFPYLFIYNKKTYAPLFESYKKFAEDLGNRNDYNCLVEQLETMPWKSHELKIVKKLKKKEEKMKKEILHKLRSSFHFSAQQTSKNTVWKSDKDTDKDKTDAPIISEEISKPTTPKITPPKKSTPPRKPGSSWSIKKPWNKS